jgi:hypothetical protein
MQVGLLARLVGTLGGRCGWPVPLGAASAGKERRGPSHCEGESFRGPYCLIAV